MDAADDTINGSRPRGGLAAALADIAERRSKMPGWRLGLDPTYSGPDPHLLERMTEDEFAAYQETREKSRRWLQGDQQAVLLRQTEASRVVQSMIAASLPIGQRIRNLRFALGWTQREIAAQIGVSRRTVIRYERGRPRFYPIPALRDLERVFAKELAAYHDATVGVLIPGIEEGR